MLTFAIPTWNRFEKLKLCLESICSQVSEENDVFIQVVNNASTDKTEELLKDYANRYSFFNYVTLNEHSKKGLSWTKSIENIKTEWTWTFGDDDFLNKGALKKVLRIISEYNTLTYIHATQKDRSNGTSKLLIANTLLDLCNQFGMIDTCGFISSNIIKTKKIQQAYGSFMNENYQKTCFIAPFCFLEHLAFEKSAILDDALLTIQDFEQTDECRSRWKEENHFNRFFNFESGLGELIKNNQKIPKTFDVLFFRYHGVHYWERLLADLTYVYEKQGDLPPEVYWEKIMTIAKFVNNLSVRKGILSTTRSIYNSIQQLVQARESLNSLIKISRSAIYPFNNVHNQFKNITVKQI